MNQWIYKNGSTLVHFDKSQSVLMHYGVPGQKWGVITKEYEPVAVDHRRTNTVSKNVVYNARPKATYNVRPRQIQKREREGYYTKENGRTVWRQNGKSYSPAEQRQKIVRRALIGVGAVAGLLAVYGALKYRQVQKAKAFSGVLDRFLSQNPGATMKTESGRNLFKRGLELAKESSKNRSAVKTTNAYLKRKNLSLSGKKAISIYKTRKDLTRMASSQETKNRLTKLIRKYRNKHTMGKLLKGVYGI